MVERNTFGIAEIDTNTIEQTCANIQLRHIPVPPCGNQELALTAAKVSPTDVNALFWTADHSLWTLSEF